MNLWKEAVRLAFDSVTQYGVAIVNKDAEDCIGLALDNDLMFYDCGTTSRRWSTSKPTHKAIRGWLWSLRDDPIWSQVDSAFMIIKQDDKWDCTVGVFVPAAMSTLIDPSNTVEFYK